MTKTVVQPYTLKRISSRMAKQFGKMSKGEEDFYSGVLLPLESNMLKVYRQHSQAHGYHARDAISMSLLSIDGYLRQIEYDFTKIADEMNTRLFEALRMGFDPFYNEEIHEAICDAYDLDDLSELRAYFGTPVRCLLRLEDSVDLHTERLGLSGYFQFIEEYIGEGVLNNEEMHFGVLLDSDRTEKAGIEFSKDTSPLD